MLEVNDVIEDKYPIYYKDEHLRIHYGNYQINNSVALQLMYWDREANGEFLYATCTVYAEGVELENDEVVIKNYAENEGILELLIQQNIVAKPHGKIPLGFVFGDICQLIEHEE